MEEMLGERRGVLGGVWGVLLLIAGLSWGHRGCRPARAAFLSSSLERRKVHIAAAMDFN